MSQLVIVQPRPVHYISNVDDRMCAILGAMGFATSFIQRETGLTPSQITYRLKKAGIRRIDYRNGTSRAAKLIVRHSRQRLDAQINDIYNLRRLNPPPKKG